LGDQIDEKGVGRANGMYGREEKYIQGCENLKERGNLE
jgi:hypothetical protein